MDNSSDRITQLNRLLEKRAKTCRTHNLKYDVEVFRGESGNLVEVTLKCSGEFGEYLNFAFLTEISELLDTKQIETSGDWYSEGCVTCDYGSESGIILTIFGAKL